MTVRKTLYLSLAAAVAGLLAPVSVRADDFQVTENWVMEISPAQKVVHQPAVAPAAPAVQTETENAKTWDAAEYARVYQSIPFNRAEYNVNPGYRHDATMEILTGNPRHQTIVRHSTQQPVVVNQTPAHVIPYRYSQPAHGLNYYFYFPYWNARGIF